MSGRPDFHSNRPRPLAAGLELIPANTLAKVRLTVRPGGAGPDGWSTQSRSSDALYLNTEAVILDGPYAKRRVCARIGIKGKSVNARGEDTFANLGRSLIRGILESARGVHPNDASDRARAARTIRSLGEMNGLIFAARIGVDRDRRDLNAERRNVIVAAITPAHKGYATLMGSGNAVVAAPAATATPPSAGAPPAAPAVPSDANKPFWAR